MNRTRKWEVLNMTLLSKYGHILSSIIQVVMYKFAADQLINTYFEELTGVAKTFLYACFIVIPLVLVKVCETRYAQSFMTKG